MRLLDFHPLRLSETQSSQVVALRSFFIALTSAVGIRIKFSTQSFDFVEHRAKKDNAFHTMKYIYEIINKLVLNSYIKKKYTMHSFIILIVRELKI